MGESQDTIEYKYRKYKTLYHQSMWAGTPDRNYYLKAKKYKNALVAQSLQQLGGQGGTSGISGIAQSYSKHKMS